jgi:nicotinate-nucleotide adenylyltransferase
MTRIGIFGGSFNPIHLAHLILAERALQERALDRILFIPALRPPHKPQRPVAPAEHRMRMVELAIEGNPAFEASRIELERRGPSYTLVTVRQLRESLGPAAELFLLLGADSVHDIPTWWRAQELVREVEIIAFERPGYSLEEDIEALAGLFGEGWVRKVQELKVQAPLIGISATEIRERVRAGKSIRYMVPEAVRQHIFQYSLYAGS